MFMSTLFYNQRHTSSTHISYPNQLSNEFHLGAEDFTWSSYEIVMFSTKGLSHDWYKGGSIYNIYLHGHHFSFNTRWQLLKLIIGFKNVVDHKENKISEVLLNFFFFAEWGINKDFTITVDNAKINIFAQMFSEWFTSVGDEALVLDGDLKHKNCCAHIINMVVWDNLHELINSIMGF